MEIKLLNPFPVHLWPVAWSWLSPVRRIVCDDYAPKTIGEFVEMKMKGGLWAIGVTADDLLAGVAMFEPVNPASVIMHVLFAPKFRGVNNTGTASRMACERVFASGVRKILGLVPENNRLAIALAVRSGGQIEGVLRNHTLRDGKPLNAVCIGITKEDFDRGTEFRRIDRRQQQQNIIDQLVDQSADVQRQPVQPAEPPGASAIEPGAIGGERGDVAASASGRDGERQPNQSDVGSGRDGDQPVPGKPRVRAKRTDRAGRPADGTGKAGGAGKQPGKRRRPPTAAK
jgi:RimJ/RimL family protein N-acetyltransferase